MLKVYLKTMGFIWFAHMLLTGSISLIIIEQNRDLVKTFINVSVVATVAMLILTIKYLKKDPTVKRNIQSI